MQYIQVSNWADYQHYSDRNPPWIKLHFDIISSRLWTCYSAQAYKLFASILLLASRHDNKIPFEKEFIVGFSQLDPELNFDGFERIIECLVQDGYLTIRDDEKENIIGYLEAKQDSKKTLKKSASTKTLASRRYQNASTKAETETETEKINFLSNAPAITGGIRHVDELTRQLTKSCELPRSQHLSVEQQQKLARQILEGRTNVL